MQNEAIFLIEKLLNYYNLTSLQELAEKLNIKQSSLSSWKSRNSINAIRNKCRELGIYNDIFGDFNSNINTQTIRDNHGNLSQTGNVYGFKENNELNNIDEAALSTFKRAYSKCVDDNGDIIEDKLDELIIYLTKFK
ncbi:MAG: helix-turn-helix domain-containing protein [Aliarcobacter sp.]